MITNNDIFDIFNDNDVDNHKKIADNELILPNGKKIVFNDQQYEAIQKINKWLKSDKTFFTLSGSAGTGKSTIVKKILDNYRYGV